MLDSSLNYQQTHSTLNSFNKNTNNNNNNKSLGGYNTRYFTEMNEEEKIVVESSARLTSLADLEPPFSRVGRDITNLLHLKNKPFENKVISQQYPTKAPLGHKNVVTHNRAISSILFAGKTNNTSSSTTSNFIEENTFGQQKQPIQVQSSVNQCNKNHNLKQFTDQISCEKENLYQPAPGNHQNHQTSSFDCMTNINGNGQKQQCHSSQQIQQIARQYPNKMEESYPCDNSHKNYIMEIISHLKATESQHNSRGGYVGTIQTEINERMRGILFDWLVDVHFKFKLRPETLYLSISLTDRYLEKVSIVSTQLQLLGITSLFIAAKYEEVYGVPHIKDLVYVCDNAYTKEELLKMEGDILQTLKFNILSVSPNRFLELFVLFEIELGEKNLLMAKYLLEIGILEYKLIGISPSMLAASVLYLVNKIRKRPISWRQELVEASGFTEADIRPTAKQVCHLVQTIEQRKYLASLKKKYSKQQFMEVAKIKIEQRKDTKPSDSNSNINQENVLKNGIQNVKRNSSGQQVQYQEKATNENSVKEQTYHSGAANQRNFQTTREVNERVNTATYFNGQDNTTIPVEPVSSEQQQQQFSDNNYTNSNPLCNNYLNNNNENNLQKPQINSVNPPTENFTSNELQLQSVQTLDIFAPIQSAVYLIESRLQCLNEKPNKYIQAILANRLYQVNAQPLSLKVPANLIVQTIEKKVGNIQTQKLWQLPAALAKLITEAMLHTEKVEELAAFSGEFIDNMIESVLAEELRNQQTSTQQNLFL